MSREILLRKLIENGRAMSAVAGTSHSGRAAEEEEPWRDIGVGEMRDRESQVRGHFYLIISLLFRKRKRLLLRE